MLLGFTHAFNIAHWLAFSSLFFPSDVERKSEVDESQKQLQTSTILHPFFYNSDFAIEKDFMNCVPNRTMAMGWFLVLENTRN